LRLYINTILVQGLRYPMKFNQQTRNFLRNEFLFGLRASQIIASSLYPQVFFLAVMYSFFAFTKCFQESNELFKSAFNPEDKENYEKGLFVIKL
jgi:hypothetical protein